MVAAREFDWVDEQWVISAEPPPLGFALERDGRQSFLPFVEGIVRHVDEQRIDIGTPGFRAAVAWLAYHLPASLDLRPLLGRRLQIQHVRRCKPDGEIEETLTIRGRDGRLWLVAHVGQSPFWQNVEGVDVSLSVSKDAQELRVGGNPGRDHLLQSGEYARVPCGRQELVAEFVEWSETGQAAYFLADASLWH
jgi:hypothetical protein